MKSQKNRLLIVFLSGALCVGVAPNPPDSAETNLHLWYGGGEYAIAGCTEATTSFRETSVSFDHKTSLEHARWGIRTSYISESRQGVDNVGGLFGSLPSPFTLSRRLLVFNPFVNLEKARFVAGAGTGFVIETETESRGDSSASRSSSGLNNLLLSLYFRAGNTSKLYADLFVLSATPFLSGGLVRYGVGTNLSPRWNLWLGMGAFPYERRGVTAEGSIRLRPWLGLNLLARHGYRVDLTSVGRVKENAFAVGATYHFKGGRK